MKGKKKAAGDKKAPGKLAGGKKDHAFETLADMRKGDRAVVVAVKSKNPEHLKVLMSLAILPGLAVRSVQTFPTPVFQSGHFQFAIDARLCGLVIVSRRPR